MYRDGKGLEGDLVVARTRKSARRNCHITWERGKGGKAREYL